MNSFDLADLMNESLPKLRDVAYDQRHGLPASAPSAIVDAARQASDYRLGTWRFLDTETNSMGPIMGWWYYEPDTHDLMVSIVDHVQTEVCDLANLERTLTRAANRIAR